MFLSTPLGKFLSRAGGQYRLSLLGKQGVCIYKRLKLTVPGDAGNRKFCLLGSIPTPLNSVSRWPWLCEPEGFLKKCRFPLRGSLRLYWQASLAVFKKSPPGTGGKSAGTVRSRRMKFCEKGFGGCATNKQKWTSGGHAGSPF